MRCTNCHAMIEDGSVFCQECGAKQGGRRCPDCGAPIPDGGSFCGECGRSLDGAPPMQEDYNDYEYHQPVSKGRGKKLALGILCVLLMIAFVITGSFIFGKLHGEEGNAGHLVETEVVSEYDVVEGEDTEEYEEEEDTEEYEEEADTEEYEEEEEETEASEEEKPTVPSVDEAGSITASATSVHHSWKNITYGAQNVLDGDLSTAWVEGASGTGEGEKITFSFDDIYEVSEIDICAGYQKNTETFYKNSAPTKIKISFSNGESEIFDLAYGMYEQTITLGKAVQTDYVIIEIVQVETGGTDWDDTAISEVAFR